jgi:hypothetical protein
MTSRPSVPTVPMPCGCCYPRREYTSDPPGSARRSRHAAWRFRDEPSWVIRAGGRTTPPDELRLARGGSEPRR